MDLAISGKNALVFGSTSGLGLAVAKALGDEGVRVAVCGRRGDVARRVAAEIPGAIHAAFDIQSEGAVGALVTDVGDRLGGIDILVLNSGGPPPAEATGLSTEALRDSLESLLVRQVEAATLVLPGMRTQGWGRVLALGSSGVQQPLPALALSNIARAGLAGYLKTLAGEVASDGVTVNMLLPGRIDTDRVASLDRSRAEREGRDLADVQSQSKSSIPAGRYGSPEEFAAVAAFLCSGRASYVTGVQVRCDGGLVRSY